MLLLRVCVNHARPAPPAQVGDVLNRLSTTAPRARDAKQRESSIPLSVLRARAAKAAEAAARATALGGDDDEDDEDGMARSAAAAARASAWAAREGDEDDDEEEGDADMEGGAAVGAPGGGAAVVRRWLERDREREGGGPGVYRPDLSKYYLLRDDEWKTDIIPEVRWCVGLRTRGGAIAASAGSSLPSSGHGRPQHRRLRRP